MQLKVKSEKIRTKRKILVFLLFFILLLIVFGFILAMVMVVSGKFYIYNFTHYYIKFIPFTVILPFIISLTTVLSFRRSLMRISPASNVNIDKLQEHFYRSGYRLIEEKPNYFRYQRRSFIARMLWFNIDKPTIEVTENEVLLTVKKLTEISLTPMITYGNHFLISPNTK